MKKYQDINAETIDKWVEEGWEWGKPISEDDFRLAKEGRMPIFLTPTVPVPESWLGDLKGKKVLGLASGGGQQMPVLAAAGAECTVLDYSARQIESELLVASREGYSIRALRADMTEPLPFEDGEFDLIVHPVSDCYVRQVRPIFRECARVLRKGGILLCGFDNGMNFLVDENEERIVYPLPFDPVANEEQRRLLEKNGDGMQFSHTIGELIGGQLEAGFTLRDLYEDTNGVGRLHEMHIYSFFATMAVKE